MAFLLGAMTLGFTACGSDNGGDEVFNLPEVGQATTSVSSQDKEMQKWQRTMFRQLFTQLIRLLPQTHANCIVQHRPFISRLRLVQ